MKKALATIAIIASVISLQAACRWHELQVGAFSSLEIENDLEVTCKFTPDSVGYVRFMCDDAHSDAFIFDKTKPTRLKIMISPDFIDNIPETTILVYTDSLKHVRSSSSRTVRIEPQDHVSKFKGVLIGNGNLTIDNISAGHVTGVLATGNGTVAISGRAKTSVLKLTGTGCIQAQMLESDKVVCHVFGGGDIFCMPFQELILKGLGSTRVHYRGKPAKIKKSGFGKLIPLDD